MIHNLVTGQVADGYGKNYGCMCSHGRVAGTQPNL